MTYSQLFSFGRLLAFVEVEVEVEVEDQDSSEELVSRGLLRVYTERQRSRGDLLLRLHQEAQENDEGLWGCRQKSQTTTSAPN